MKEDSSMAGKMYSKNTGIGALILEWIPISVGLVLIGTLIGSVLAIIWRMLIQPDFDIWIYLASDSASFGLCIYSLGGFAVSLFVGLQRYYLINKKFFASANDEKIMLRFGRNSFPWENIQNVDFEGGRKLIITVLDEGEIKENLFDLKWLSQKEDFIKSLMDYCTAKKIPYQEGEPNSSSRIKLFLNFLIRYPFV
jgi:hypothetical protein